MSTGTLRDLLPGGTLRLLIHLILHPDEKLHFRALKQRTGLGTGSLQRELARLEGLGLVSRTEERGRVCYEPDLAHPSWEAFRTLLREHADPVDVLRDALSGVEGIKLAFLYGSTVRGDARADSDLDVFIVQDGMPLASIGRAATEAESLLDRAVDIRSFTPSALARKLQRGSAFLTDALDGPKVWLVGTEDLLPVREVA